MNRIISLLMFLAFCFTAQAQVIKTKTIDNGGSGMYKAVAVKEKGLEDFVIYRPKDFLFTHAREGALPILMFANGGCSDTSIGYERMLNEIASHGYVVVAIGEMQDKRFDRPEGHAPTSDLKRGLDWIVRQCRTKGSEYYDNVDTMRVAAAGHSCGGAQVLANAADPRYKTCLILNAGMGDMEMAGASKVSLKSLHCPVLYVTGGPKDVAYDNARLDYGRIGNVPVVLADNASTGHGGTYGSKYGGDYGRLVIDWLDWQLKGEKENAEIFMNGKLDKYKGWTVRSKNFHKGPGRYLSLTMPCKMLTGITERQYSIYLPYSYQTDSLTRFPVLYMLHGGGLSHDSFEKSCRLSHLADSLIDGHTIDGMIIVCPEANKNNMMYFNAEKGRHGAPDWQYEDFFFKEFIPYIESHYRTRTDRGGRAIAGFSMGGGAATVYGVHHPELFSMAYDISGYQRPQSLPFLKGDASASWRQEVIGDNDPIKRIMNGSDEEVKKWRQTDWKVAVGDHDFTLDANLDLIKALHGKGITPSIDIRQGVHDMNWVGSSLPDLLKRADRNFKSLWIDNDGRHIYGAISKPRYNGKRQPLAIVAHGFNGTHSSANVYYDNLNSLGYQVYAMDFPNGSVNSRSDNNTMKMSVINEKNDLKAIVRYFRSQPDIDKDNIILIGESQGGLVSALAASEIPKEISRLVLVFPALCIPDNWNTRYPEISDIPDTTRVWNIPLGKDFFIELRDIDVFKKIKKFKNPVLIIQGDNDKVVSMDDSKRAVKTYKDARLKVIPGAGHGFRPKEQELSQKYIREFIEKQ